MITIKFASNGAILTIDGSATLFKFDEENKQELVEMLYEILSEFDLSTKHDKERIVIKIEHGRDYECKDNNCSICKEI